MKNIELSRLKTVIENDRLTMTNDNLSLIEVDLFAVLNDYFALCGMPEIFVSASGSEYLISIKAKAQAVKSFRTVQRGKM